MQKTHGPTLANDGTRARFHNDEHFQFAKKHYPRRQVLHYVNGMVQAGVIQRVTVEELEFGLDTLVCSRYADPICRGCWPYKKTTEGLKRCTKCYVEWYCSKGCQQNDRAEHKKWCGKPRADVLIKDDPYHPVVMRLPVEVQEKVEKAGIKRGTVGTITRGAKVKQEPVSDDAKCKAESSVTVKVEKPVVDAKLDVDSITDSVAKLQV